MGYKNNKQPIKQLNIGKVFSLHYCEEGAWYIYPSLMFQRMKWAQISGKKEVTYLLVVKFIKWAVGIMVRVKDKSYRI